jgi:hypothetical protein
MENNNTPSPFAQKKALFYFEKIKKKESAFALFRLVSTLVLLALLVGLVPSQNALNVLGIIFFFLVFCLTTGAWHNAIQAQAHLWQALSLAYQLAFARKLRDFKFLSAHLPPWHAHIAISPNPEHPYAHDLRVHQELFLLFNTCTTPQGSQKLFSLFTNAGLNPEPLEKLTARAEKAALLAPHTKLLRTLEALKLQKFFLETSFKNNTHTHTPHRFFTSSSLWIYCSCFVSFIAWIFIVCPAFISFTHTLNSEKLLHALFFYALFLVLGAFVCAPLTKRAKQLSKLSLTLTLILKTLGNQPALATQLGHTFLKPQSKRHIQELHLLTELLSLRGNPLFWLTLHALLPFDAVLCTLLQFKINSLKQLLAVWEEELCEFDVLTSFARFHRENKSTHFVTAQERQQSHPHRISCTALGHPLLPEHTRVCNNLSLTLNAPVVLLTGSNMAGKSTFLRTLATNILLANMGAPVCAQHFYVVPSRLLCALGVEDSLTQGTSYFYAEVKRLRFLLSSLNAPNTVPAFFCIDEIFRGTNNKERLVGSWHVLLALVKQNSFGFVSTHDLALAKLSQADCRLLNMHFKDHVENDTLVFDYTLQAGPCPTTNALHIMRQAGLPLPSPQECEDFVLPEDASLPFV